MQVNDDVFLVGVIDRRMALTAPGFVGQLVVRKYPDDLETVEVDEIHSARIFYFAAKNEVEELRHGAEDKLVGRDNVLDLPADCNGCAVSRYTHIEQSRPMPALGVRVSPPSPRQEHQS